MARWLYRMDGAVGNEDYTHEFKRDKDQSADTTGHGLNMLSWHWDPILWAFVLQVTLIKTMDGSRVPTAVGHCEPSYCHSLGSRERDLPSVRQRSSQILLCPLCLSLSKWQGRQGPHRGLRRRLSRDRDALDDTSRRSIARRSPTPVANRCV